MRCDLSLLASSLFFLPYRNPAGWIWRIVFVGWSLNFEMFFYVSFACALALSDHARLLALSVLLLGLAGGQLVDEKNPLWLTYTSPLLWSFYREPGSGRYSRHPNGGVPACRQGSVARLDPRRRACRRLLVASNRSWGGGRYTGGRQCMVREYRGNAKFVSLKLLGDASYSIYLFQQFAMTLSIMRSTLWPGLLTLPVTRGPWPIA